MVLQDSRLYEAMFLVDTNIASDPEATKGMIRTVMDRAHAELLVCSLWDERRLAYDIDKHKRAAYVLCYFRADGADIKTMERDVQLSEHLLRVLVLRADHISPEQLEQIISDAQPKPEAQTPADTSSESAPVEDTPAKEDAPAKDVSAEPITEDAPAEDALTEDTPAEPTSKDAAAEEVSSEDTPAEPTTKDAADEEVSTEDPPAEPSS